MAKQHTTNKPLDVHLTTLDEHCTVCDRVPFGEVQYLGHRHWRHAQCAPGSSEWVERYRSLPKTLKSRAGDLLYESAVVNHLT